MLHCVCVLMYRRYNDVCRHSCTSTFLLSLALSLPELFSRTSLSSCPPRPLSLPPSLSFPSSLARSAPSLVTFHLFHRAANPYFCRLLPRPAAATLSPIHFSRAASPSPSSALALGGRAVRLLFFFLFSEAEVGCQVMFSPIAQPPFHNPSAPLSDQYRGLGNWENVCAQLFFCVSFSWLRCYLRLRRAASLLPQSDPIRLSGVTR